MSKMSRSAYGLDVGGEVSWQWKQRAACSKDSELWFGESADLRAEAIHICARHCDVARECSDATAAEVAAGLRPESCVQAGVYWSQQGRVSAHQGQSRVCRRCPERMEVGLPEMPKKAIAPKAPRAPGRPLVDRSEEILAYLAEGFSDAEIGAKLFLSVEGVKSHMRRLYFKLGARNRAHAVALAFRKGWLK